jgi:hypothetical protein
MRYIPHHCLGMLQQEYAPTMFHIIKRSPVRIKSGMLLLWILLNTGCSSIIEFPETSVGVSYPVIEAILTDSSETQEVRVTLTTGVNDTVSCIPVTGAHVAVRSDDGDTVLYRYADNGWYVSQPFAAIHGKSYTLEVKIDTATYLATCHVIPMYGIDSLYYKYLPENENDTAGYYVYFNAGPADPLIPAYYQVNIIKNGQLLNKGDEIAIFNDKYLKSIKEIDASYTFSQNDTVTIELLSLSQGMYDYYYSLFNNLFFLNMNSLGYKANPPQMFSNNALGYFQISAIDSKKIIIR